MYLYIDLDDLGFFTSISGVVSSGTLEFPNIICEACGSYSLETVTTGRGNVYSEQKVEIRRKYDALMVCLDCGNEFWLRQSVAVF